MACVGWAMRGFTAIAAAVGVLGGTHALTAATAIENGFQTSTTDDEITFERLLLGVDQDRGIARVPESFLGVNTDWWIPGCGGEGKDWAPNASAATVDLSNPRLRTLAAGLAGATWRIGGTHCDSVSYVVGNTSAAAACKAGSWTPKKCYPVCLTMDRFAEITEFASAAGLKLAFGLNMKSTDPTNLIDFVTEVARRNLSVDTWEMGNELGIGQILQNGGKINDALQALYSGNPSARPLLAGPDDAGDGDDASRLDFATLVRNQSFLAAITFHAYAFHNGGGPELSEHMLQVALLDQQAEIYDKMLAVVRNGSSEAYRPAVWMGEGNAAGHGGRPGITNTFANSFWYSNAMGHAASHGISRFLRQTLIGGGYELLNGTTFLPNPDYWIAVLYQRVMGRTALAVTAAAPSSTIRSYATCANPGGDGGGVVAAGDVAMLLLNFDANATVLVTVNVTGTSRLLWQLRSGAKATVLSKSVSLLGTGLLGLTAGGQLPELRPVAAKWRIGGLLSMPPQSIAFVVFQGSRAPACIH